MKWSSKLPHLLFFYSDEHEDFKEEMERLRALRGKSKKDRKKRKGD
jgi:hypothetical protein